MRISDWSSDVCSSDLEDHRGEIAVDRAAEVGGHAAFKFVIALTAEIGAVRHRRRHPGDDDAQRVRRQRLRSDRCGIGEQRSEEHTSELQSLMRISYAVFCLKKQKTKPIL